MCTYLYHTPYAVLRERVSISAHELFEVDDAERMMRIHLAAMFATKVLDACRARDITPWSATGSTLNVTTLMSEAERQLGIAVSETELSLMNRWRRYETQYLSSQRRQYAYSMFLKMTSGALR